MNTRHVQQFSKLLLFYILLQPFLDIITGWQVRLLPHFGLTAGVLVRAVMLLAVLLFIVQAAKAQRNWIDRNIGYYLMGLLLLAVLNLGINKFSKPVFSLFTEAAGTFKSMYYLIILVGFYYAFRNLSARQIKRLVPAIVYWAQCCVSVSMILAHWTQTAFKTYPQGKLGESGWFNAGNELGAILAITFPIVTLYAIKQTQKYGYFWYWLGVFLMVIAIIMVGTKSCFYGMIIGIFFVLVNQFCFYWWHHRQQQRSFSRRYFYVNLVMIVLMLGGILGMYPHAPVKLNSTIQMEIIKDNQKNQKEILKEKKAHRKLSHYEKFLVKNQELNNPLVAKLLSGRTNYFRTIKAQYHRANWGQKLFGLGYGGNYRHKPLTIEMDWVDFFFQFGVIGFLITMTPLVGIIVYLLYRFFKGINTAFIWDNLLYFVAFGLGIFMSIISGHVLNAPGVSTYLGLVAAYLLNYVAHTKNYDFNDHF